MTPTKDNLKKTYLLLEDKFDDFKPHEKEKVISALETLCKNPSLVYLGEIKKRGYDNGYAKHIVERSGKTIYNIGREMGLTDIKDLRCFTTQVGRFVKQPFKAERYSRDKILFLLWLKSEGYDPLNIVKKLQGKNEYNMYKGQIEYAISKKMHDDKLSSVSKSFAFRK